MRLSALVLGVVVGLAEGVSAQDEIRYVEHVTKKELKGAGTIQEESPSQVVYKPAAGAGTKEVPAIDIVDIVYEVPPAIRLLYGRAQNEERRAADPALKEEDQRKTWSDAIKSYQEVVAKANAGKNKFLQRHLQFKIARLLALQAQNDASQQAAAIEALSKFVQDYPDGWQLMHAARLLARLQTNHGDLAAARKTYQSLTQIPALPKELVADCELRIVESWIQEKNYAEAEKAIQALAAPASGNEALATRIKIYRAACQAGTGKLADAAAQLDALIAKTTDPELKAFAYNTLGDCFRVGGKPREALWRYLWVDVIYHQDKEEHRRAMEELARLFEDQGETARAKQYRERLRRETR